MALETGPLGTENFKISNDFVGWTGLRVALNYYGQWAIGTDAGTGDPGGLFYPVELRARVRLQILSCYTFCYTRADRFCVFVQPRRSEMRVAQSLTQRRVPHELLDRQDVDVGHC